ncbi:hypothetical protein BH11ARM1_BH11ARM1_12280 [soil metagenome]
MVGWLVLLDVKPKASIKRRVARTGLLLLALYLGGCYALACLYLSPIRTVPTCPKGFTSTFVGTTPIWETADLSRQKPSSTMFVFGHGYGGDRSQWTEVMKALKAKGFDSIDPALAGQDASRVATVGFGGIESYTLAKMVEYAKGKGAKNVILSGVSMGGAASWLATERTTQVDAVVSESAFADFPETMNHWLDMVLPGGHISLLPTVWFARMKSGINPADIVPLKAAAQWKGKPALVIQAGDDKLIDGTNADRLAAASGAPIWIVPKASHANCATVDLDGYVAHLIGVAHMVSR